MMDQHLFFTMDLTSDRMVGFSPISIVRVPTSDKVIPNKIKRRTFLEFPGHVVPGRGDDTYVYIVEEGDTSAYV